MAGAEVGVAPGEHGGVGQQPEIATLVFNDGSKYTGTLKHGTPHGLGTCVWRDGNQYDGEWRNGLMHGFGTYLWTSGQRYDGEWKDGKREGVGVKMYADGSTFHGIWRDGRKHGVGVFKPAAKEKDKERAKSVVKTSSGRLLGPPVDGDSVSNLNAYESVQQTDTPIQADDKESSHGGAIEPAAVPAASGASMDAERERARDRDKDGQRDRPRDKEKEKDKDKEKERKVVFIRAFVDGELRREEKLTSDDAKMIFGQPLTTEEKGRGSKARKKVKRALGLGKKLQQKHGQLLYKGMPGYNLMLRLQHGIRWSVGRSSYATTSTAGAGQEAPLQPAQHTNSLGGAAGPIPLSHVLKPSDFTEKVKVFFPSTGSKQTPAHPAGDFKWKDYAPRVFRNLRNMYGIADADYMLSLGGSSALWQLNSPGKSGCMFFLSDDERFLVKTMRKTEIRTLLDLLPQYYKYMETQPQNLVIRFFGVHGVKQLHGRTVRFVVMHNMFNTDLQIHKKFDLKGSTDGRTTGPNVDGNDSKTIFKDLDLDMQFFLDPASHAALVRQISSDAEFLRKLEVMDYSLLLGIHFCNRMRVSQENESSITQQLLPDGQQPQRLLVAGTAPGAGRAGGDSPSGNAAATAAAPGTGAAGSQQQPVALQSMSSHDSTDGDELPGPRVSPPRPVVSAQPQSPGALGLGARVAGASGEDPDGDHVRNFDLFSDRVEVEKQMDLYEKRMRDLGYSEQRIQDILDLVKLRILGDKMKRTKKAYKVYDGPATVLKALASRRHGPDSMPRVEEADEQQGSDDDGEEMSPAAKQPACMGYQMRAIAVHRRGDLPPEDVVLCFGIIDILQEWNVRKVLERTVKTFTHDPQAISVAPPKLYSIRFADFLKSSVFLSVDSGAARGLGLPPLQGSTYGLHTVGVGVHTIDEERESEHRGV